MGKNAPECSKCQASEGAQFKVFTRHGFGKYCATCEDIVDALVSAVRIITLQPARK